MIFGIDRKKRRNSAVRQKKMMSEKNQEVTAQGRSEVEVGTLLLSNDKNNVIADKVLSYF